MGRELSGKAGGVMEWQPIETAPKDRPLILLGYEPNIRMKMIPHVHGGRWNDDRQAWDSGFVSGYTMITHWIPMPPLPDKIPT